MMQESRPKPLLSGVVYGECAFWLAITGMIVGIIGMGIYLFQGNQFFDANVLLKELLAGKDVRTIWESAATSDVLHGHWYISRASYGDGLAMIGIAVCCSAAVVGIWAAIISMLVGREKPYLFAFFGLIIAVILSLSAAGILAIR